MCRGQERQKQQEVRIRPMVQDREIRATLHAAQKHPEEYRDLLVRVAGYSDYFNDMNTDLQYDVIARTAQETL